MGADPRHPLVPIDGSSGLSPWREVEVAVRGRGPLRHVTDSGNSQDLGGGGIAIVSAVRDPLPVQRWQLRRNCGGNFASGSVLQEEPEGGTRLAFIPPFPTRGHQLLEAITLAAYREAGHAEGAV